MNKLSGQVYEYLDDLDAETILGELLAAPLPPSTSASPLATMVPKEVTPTLTGQVEAIQLPSGHRLDEAPSPVHMPADGASPETESDRGQEQIFGLGRGVAFWPLTGLVILGLGSVFNFSPKDSTFIET